MNFADTFRDSWIIIPHWYFSDNDTKKILRIKKNEPNWIEIPPSSIQSIVSFILKPNQPYMFCVVCNHIHSALNIWKIICATWWMENECSDMGYMEWKPTMETQRVDLNIKKNNHIFLSSSRSYTSHRLNALLFWFFCLAKIHLNFISFFNAHDKVMNYYDIGWELIRLIGIWKFWSFQNLNKKENQYVLIRREKPYRFGLLLKLMMKGTE